MQQNLQSMAGNPEAFHAALTQSFGEHYDKAGAEAIREQTLSGDFSWMPTIKVVDGATLSDQSGTQRSGTALGAYSAETDTIYISAELLGSDPAKAVAILTEEVGHALDARLNTSDAAGDEGDIFARIVGGETISAAELGELRAENDSGTIIVDGRSVDVEYGLGSFIKKSVKRVSGAIKGAVDSIKDSVKDVVDSVKDVAKDAWRSVEKGFKSLMQNPILQSVMAVAQFIPIPVVAVVARAYNAASAMYSAYQGIKHGSIGAVLRGVAGMAGGASQLGGILGASQKFVDTAARIGQYAGQASQAYHAIAEKDFTAALAMGAAVISRHTGRVGSRNRTSGVQHS